MARFSGSIYLMHLDVSDKILKTFVPKLFNDFQLKKEDTKLENRIMHSFLYSDSKKCF
jgi:hypothetical protein